MAKRSLRTFFTTFFSGMCVGAADIVPGISGGTVAFIIGVYEELLKSIATINVQAFKSLIKFRFKELFNTIAWPFLAAFLLGVATSFLTLAKGFNYLLHHETYRVFLYAGFMGLVVGSVIFCARLLPRFTYNSALWFVLGAMLAWWISGIEMNSTQTVTSYDVPLKPEFLTEKVATCSNFDPYTNCIMAVPESELPVMVAKHYLQPQDQIYLHDTNTAFRAEVVVESLKLPFIDLWLVVCGALAISAMLLPGISGSYLLNILGMYGIVLGALVDWTDGLKSFFFDFSSFRILVSMGLGIALGAIVFARAVNYLLVRFRTITLSCLTGFMVGALKAVWPFWTYGYKLEALHISDGPILYTIEPIMPDVVSITFALSTVSFLAGVAIVLIIEYVASKRRVYSTEV